MKGSRDSEACRAAERILDYLAGHGEAADTADGIARWWLAGEPPTTVDVVARALKLLAEEHEIEQQTLPDGTVIYRGARAHSHEQ